MTHQQSKPGVDPPVAAQPSRWRDFFREKAGKYCRGEPVCSPIDGADTQVCPYIFMPRLASTAKSTREICGLTYRGPSCCFLTDYPFPDRNLPWQVLQEGVYPLGLELLSSNIRLSVCRGNEGAMQVEYGDLAGPLSIKVR